MKELKINYNALSPNRQVKRDQIQLICAAVSMIIGYLDTFKVYTGFFIILPVFGLILAIVNLLFARYYESFTKRYGDKFQIWISRLNGVVVFLAGIGYHISGSKYIQYAYYVIALLYFVVLPNFLMPAVKKKLVLLFSESEFIVKKRFTIQRYSWHDIGFIRLQDGVLQVKHKDVKKMKKYFIRDNAQLKADLYEFLHALKEKSEYSFNL